MFGNTAKTYMTNVLVWRFVIIAYTMWIILNRTLRPNGGIDSDLFFSECFFCQCNFDLHLKMKDAFVVVGLLTQYKGRKLHKTRLPQKYRRWPCTAGLLEIRVYTLQSVLCWVLLLSAQWRSCWWPCIIRSWCLSCSRCEESWVVRHSHTHYSCNFLHVSTQLCAL